MGGSGGTIRHRGIAPAESRSLRRSGLFGSCPDTDGPNVTSPVMARA